MKDKWKRLSTEAADSLSSWAAVSLSLSMGLGLGLWLLAIHIVHNTPPWMLEPYGLVSCTMLPR